jgi:hypothetical protein
MDMTQQTPPQVRPRTDADLVHSSTRTRLSTNVDSGAARLTVATTRLEMRAQDGDLVVTFSAHCIDGLPMRAAANRSQYRGRTR